MTYGSALCPSTRAFLTGLGALGYLGFHVYFFFFFLKKVSSFELFFPQLHPLLFG
jgi:hypothetical protein